MNQSKIPVRYAKALFLLGREKGLLKNLSEEVKLLSRFFETSPKLLPWLRSPVIRANEKKELFRRNFKGQISPLMFNFIDLVIDKKRDRFFPDIFRVFLSFHKAEAGIKTLTITTAIEVDDTLKKKISQSFSERNATGHELVMKIKPSIIGGFMLQVDDELYDASIATEIRRLNKELTGQLMAGIGIEPDIEK